MTKIALKTAIVLFGLMGISLAGFLWRLSSAPISLDGLIPVIEKAAGSLSTEFSAGLEGVELYWDRQENSIQLRATQITLLDGSVTKIIVIPAIDISISVSALLKRAIAPSELNLKGVHIHLVRMKDGSFKLGTRPSNLEPNIADPGRPRLDHDMTDMVTHVFGALESAPDPQLPLSYLKSFELGGVLTIDDRKLGMQWVINDVSFSFHGKDEGVAGSLSLSFDQPQPMAGINIRLSLLAQGKDVTAKLEGAGIRPSRLSALDPRLEILKGVDLALSGTASAEIALPETLKSLAVDVKGGAGSIGLDQFLSKSLQVKEIELKATTKPATKRIDVSKLKLSLEQEESTALLLEANGFAQSDDDGVTITVDANLNDFAVESLAAYWPTDLAAGARTWLTENLKTGTVDSASLNLGMTVPTRSGKKLNLETLDGTINWSDLSVYYFRPLPPVVGVNGKGTFNQHGFDVVIDQGSIGGAAIKSGTLLIANLDADNPGLNLETEIEGRAADILSILESPPIDLAKVIGFSAAQTAGEVTADLQIELPLKSGLTPADITYWADATLANASVEKIFHDYSVGNASIEIHDHPDRLDINGSLEIDGIPVTLVWDGVRKESGAIESRIKARADRITAQDVTRLGFPADKYLTGSFSLGVDTTLSPGDAILASVDADLTESELSIPTLNWNKPAGTKGITNLSFHIGNDGIVHITDVTVDAGTLDISGAATFNTNTSELKAGLESVQLGKNSLKKLHLSHSSDKGTKIMVDGGQIDLESLVSSGITNKDTKNSNVSAAPQTEKTGSGARTFQIEFTGLDKVLFGTQRYIEDVNIRLMHDDVGWQSISINGRNNFRPKKHQALHFDDDRNRLSEGQFIARFGPSVDERYPILIEIENVGALLSTTLGKNDLDAGYLVIRGESTGPLLTKQIEASVEFEKFNLANAPLVTQLFSFLSLEQIVSTLDAEGLLINSLSSDLTLLDSTISIKQLKAHGDSVGMTAKGRMDFADGVLSLEGGVAPLYEISNIASKIPLFKKIVTGDDGQGIIVMEYTIEGPVDAPEISVNPGSLLTPGILRDIFSLDDHPQ